MSAPRQVGTYASKRWGQVPPMPPTVDRRLYLDDKPHLGLESDNDWCDNNRVALAWFIDNHQAIRIAVAKATGSTS